MEEEFDLYSINAIRSMEIVDFNRGKKVGLVQDIKIDMENSKIVSLLLPVTKGTWFSKTEWLEIPWERVVQVGEDIILVDINWMDESEVGKNTRLFP